jgi:dTMP kinase
VADVSIPDAVTARAPHPPDAPTVQDADPVVVPGTSSLRLFGSGSFFRLWLAQVVSSLGDWIGLVAILALAARVGGRAGNSGAAVGIVMSARMIPGFFLAPVGGVLVDRWNRKKVMVLCDVGRGLVVATLPFVDSVLALFCASLVLEVLTLLWSPAKEATVPNLVKTEQLTNANSLSLAAAYGTFPIAAAVSAVLFKVAEALSHHQALHVFRVNRESIALYFDVITFFISAVMISTLVLPKSERRSGAGEGKIDMSRTFVDLKEGWHFIGSSRVVRAVMVGLGTGLIGGGMVVPLGVDFSTKVLGAGPAGFSVLLTALGFGVALGVLLLSALQKRLPKERIFTTAVLVAGCALVAGATTSRMSLAVCAVALFGICAGAVYVVGFTLLHENVADELRGRIFATLYTLIRLCLLVSLAAAPFLSGFLDKVSWHVVGPDRAVDLGGTHLPLPGVRLTLWFGGAVILLAGLLAVRTLEPQSRKT